MEKTIGEFLDHFYGLPAHERAATLAEPPPLTDDPRTDALVGAIAEHLAKSHAGTGAPAWAEAPARFLPLPWFTAKAADAALCEYLTYCSPAAFKRRNVMTDDTPLLRARTPR